MNDPKVVALIYTVEPVRAGRYDNAGPLRHSDEPEFDLTVEDKIARFEFKKFYRTVHEAREAIEPFIQNWVFPVAMREESDGFMLEYKEAEIVDRNPLPPGPRLAPKQLRATAVYTGAFTIAELTVVSPDYPPPPAGGSVDLDDPAVVKMKSKYEEYRLGATTLPDAANFCCVTALKEKYGSIPEAAKQCGISKRVLGKISELSAKKAGRKHVKLKALALSLQGKKNDFWTEPSRRSLSEQRRWPLMTASTCPRSRWRTCRAFRTPRARHRAGAQRSSGLSVYAGSGRGWGGV